MPSKHAVRKEGCKMPFYMDIHKNVKGLTPEKVADAYRKDLEVQEKHSVKFLK